MTTHQGVATTITVLQVVGAAMIFLPRVVIMRVISERTVALLPTEEVGADLEAVMGVETSAPIEMTAQI